MNPESKARYFTELAICLRREGFSAAPPADGLLPVALEGAPLCLVTGSGTIRYRPPDLKTPALQRACDAVADIAGKTFEYMHLMELAPFLKASSLDERYRLLADFNGIVLAGRMPLENQGCEFVTWQWSYHRTGVQTGHYFSNNYAAAKQDFALRAGLIPSERLFSDAQLAEIHCCITTALENDASITDAQLSMLSATARQIEDYIPSLAEHTGFPERAQKQEAPSLQM